MTTATRKVLQSVVQTATVFGSWTTRKEITAKSASEGAGQILGDAMLSRPYGLLRRVDPDYSGGSVGQVTDTRIDIAGQWVRILLEDPTASDLTIGTTKYRAIWYGIVDQQRTIADGGTGTGEQAWMCSGLSASLDRVTICRGYEAATSNNTHAIDPGYMPPFNVVAGGDRSVSTESFTDLDRAAYVHNREIGLWPGANATQWRALDIVSLLLAGFSNRYFLPPNWRLSIAGVPATSAVKWQVLDPDGCLLFIPRPVDLNGMTVLQAVNTLISPRRGLTWFLTVSGSNAYINVRSVSASSIVLGTTIPYTLPASTRTWAPNLSASPFIADLVVDEDHSAVYDYIEVNGARPWVTTTLWLRKESSDTDRAFALDATCPLVKGWTSDEEDNFLDANWYSLPSGTPISESVHRRFLIAPSWNWRQYPGDDESKGISNDFDTIVDTETGRYGFSGIRGHDEYSPAVSTYATWGIEFTRELPGGVGFNTVGQGSRQGPLVFQQIGTNWRDLNGTFHGINGHSFDKVMHIDVQNAPGAVHLGQSLSDAAEMYAALKSGCTYAITVGVREPCPLKVSWRRDWSTQPRDAARVLSVNAPQFEKWTVKAGTVVGVNIATGALITQATDQDVGNQYGMDGIRMLLSLLRIYYGQPAVTLRWTDYGSIDIADASGPARLITNATIHAATSVPIYAVVTRRQWTLTGAGYGTSYTTERMVPDIEAVV